MILFIWNLEVAHVLLGQLLVSVHTEWPRPENSLIAVSQDTVDILIATDTGTGISPYPLELLKWLFQAEVAHLVSFNLFAGGRTPSLLIQ